MMKSVLFPCFPKFLKISIEDTGIESIEDHGIAIQSVGGFINISGLGNSEKVDFFGIDGNAHGSARSIYGSVSFPARQGTVVVARIGKESVKVAVEQNSEKSTKIPASPHGIAGFYLLRILFHL